MIIAIDGPSGAGKSTLGKMIAKHLGLLYLDTGAMYRAVGLAVLQSQIDSEDSEKITELAEQAEIELIGVPNDLKILLNARDVSKEIRTNEVGQMASIVSTISGVRENLVKRQRQLGKSAKNGAVLDGRDIGTVVFPNADIKFFLTASAESRAKRRYKEDLEKGIEMDYQKTLNEINKRDERDKNRKHSPLKIPQGGVIINSDGKNIEQVFEEMLEHLEKL